VMVGSLNDRNIGLLRIEEIWLYRYNKSQTAMIPGLWCLNSTLKVKEMYIHLFMLCLYMNCYEYSKRIKFNCYLLILFAVYALCSSVLSFTASSFLNTDQYISMLNNLNGLCFILWTKMDSQIHVLDTIHIWYNNTLVIENIGYNTFKMRY
jgi:hypothetical protein